MLLSTYICHPSMANNELSGPVVATALARWLASAPRRLTYRVVFVPETIGAILYLSRNLSRMKASTIAGFVLTCIGDDRTYSFLHSRMGDTLADRVAQHVLRHTVGDYKTYSYLERGSDERQYCAPGVDLPVVSIMRTKYGEYPEYHTSADDLSLITPSGLAGGLAALMNVVEVLENDGYYRIRTLCEPQLGKRGLYPSVSTKDTLGQIYKMSNVLGYCDGRHDLVALSEAAGVSALDAIPLLKKFQEHSLVERSSEEVV